MTISTVMSRYEAKLDRMISNMAEEIIFGAKARLLRSLKDPKTTSPLVMSIGMEADPEGGVRVFTDKPYARFVEFGTFNQAARPFLTPAAEEVKVTFARLASDLK